MDLQDVRQLMRDWVSKVGYKITHCPPEAKFITGFQRADAQLHYFKVESGIELKIDTEFQRITGYDIIDEEKFVWFMLRWSS